jgi:Cu/Ag efflux protein CusF
VKNRTKTRAPLAVLAALALACSGGVTEGDGTGVVQAIAAERGAVTLAHGEIPGLMKAMTMEFAVAKPEQLNGLEVGETVAFHLVYADGAYTITELRETPAP